jgi:Ca2+-binding RTX toxin-like protein
MFIEQLENRALFSVSAAPVVPNPFAFIIKNNPNADVVSFQQGPIFYLNGWSADASGAPEAIPTWTNSVSGAQFSQPTLNDSGRLQITGTPGADQISSEQVTGINTTSDLPAFVFEPTSADEFQTMHAKFVYDFFASQTDKVPDARGGFESAPQLVQDYQQALSSKEANPPAGWSQDDVTQYNNIIACLNWNIKHYQEQLDRFKNVSFTLVHVAGKYDVYVESPDTPITIAIDAGAGNDTISIAPNVNAKTSILGGKGNDMLISGKMHTYLAGGAGNDVLVSRSKHGGTLDGGPGTDTFDSRFGSILVADATSSDFVGIHGQSYPMATAAASSKISMKNTTFSDIFVTPDGLV